ncbi:MAG: serine/threonine protein kinase [Clostridiales bacterium]|nr:serine/threonine protein kinase [Clostridiales bacterium]
MQDLCERSDMVLAGRYELQKQIGEGGFSIVYLAWDKHICRQVAIKAQKEPEEAKTEDVLRNEMEMLRELKHSMLTEVYDFFYEDRWYLVMEYIDGVSLHNIIEQEGKISVLKACEWALEILRLFSYLHGHGTPIVYQDLKPENIMVCGDGSLKVVDFGAAFSLKDYYGGKSGEKRAGTIGYAAPEQIEGESFEYGVDERSDIYTFGAVLYHMLTGDIPNSNRKYGLSVKSAHAGVAQELERKIRKYNAARIWHRGKHTELRRVNADIPQELERIVKKCTAVDKSMRYQTVEDIITDLEYVRYKEGQNRRQLLYSMEKRVWLTDNKAVGLLTIGILLVSMFIGSFTLQAKGRGAELPVIVYNKQGQRLVIRHDSTYKTEGNLVFELERKLFTGEDIHTLNISLTNSETGQMQERTFYIQGAAVETD